MMRAKLAVLTLALSLAACAGDAPPVMNAEFVAAASESAAAPQAGCMSVWNNLGGEIAAANAVRALMEKGLRICLRRDCASACTLLLAEPGLCYAEDARFYFHAPTIKGMPDRGMAERMLATLPPRLAARLGETHALENVSPVTALSAREVAALDRQPRFCKS